MRIIKLLTSKVVGVPMVLLALGWPGNAAAKCQGHRQCIKTVCWLAYVPPNTPSPIDPLFCMEVSSFGYGSANEVQALDAGTKVFDWDVTYFRGHHFLTGPVYIDLNPDRTSSGIIKSFSTAGGPPGGEDEGASFFPATSTIEFYFDVRVPNFGWSLYNKEPAIVHSREINAIPPKGSTFDLQSPVAFYHRSRPNDAPVVSLQTAHIIFEPEPRFSMPLWLIVLLILNAVALILGLVGLIRLKRQGRAPGRQELKKRLGSTLRIVLLVGLLFVMALLWTYRSLTLPQLAAIVLSILLASALLQIWRAARGAGPSIP